MSISRACLPSFFLCMYWLMDESLSSACFRKALQQSKMHWSGTRASPFYCEHLSAVLLDMWHDCDHTHLSPHSSADIFILLKLLPLLRCGFCILEKMNVFIKAVYLKLAHPKSVRMKDFFFSHAHDVQLKSLLGFFFIFNLTKRIDNSKFLSFRQILLSDRQSMSV